MFDEKPYVLDFVLPPSEHLFRRTMACAVNSMIFLLAQEGKHMPLEEIIAIMKPDSVGVDNSPAVYQRLSKEWRAREYGITPQYSKWKTKEQLLRELRDKKTGIPVLFHMYVLDFIKKYLELDGRTFVFEDLWDSHDKHILILVGFDPVGNELLFVDPSYQLPWYTEEQIKSNIIRISSKDFSECTKNYKTFIKVRPEKRKKSQGRQVKLL